MLALTVVFAASLYLVGLRADRIHAGRAVTEPGADRARSCGASRPDDGCAHVEQATTSGSVTVPVRYRGLTASEWAAKYRRRTRQLQNARRDRQRHWAPTVRYALTLASAVFAVPYSDLASVSWCESTWNPYARNGRQFGLFQLGWRPFGLDPYDPVANALSAAATVRHDGSWRQWVCKP